MVRGVTKKYCLGQEETAWKISVLVQSEKVVGSFKQSLFFIAKFGKPGFVKALLGTQISDTIDHYLWPIAVENWISKQSPL